MRINNYVSEKEHKSLLLIAFTAFIFVLLIISFQIIENYNLVVSKEHQILKNEANIEQTPQFANDSIERSFPGFHLLTIFIFLALLKTKRFLISSFLTTFYAVVFTYGLCEKYKFGFLSGKEFTSKFDILDRVYRMANNYEYFAAVFISILFFWQISILLRMLIKTFHKDTGTAVNDKTSRLRPRRNAT